MSQPLTKGYVRRLLVSGKETYNWAKYTANENEILAKSLGPSVERLEETIVKICKDKEIDRIVNRLIERIDNRICKDLKRGNKTKQAVVTKINENIDRILEAFGLQRVSEVNAKINSINEEKEQLSKLTEAMSAEKDDLMVEIAQVREGLRVSQLQEKIIDDMNKGLLVSLDGIKNRCMVLEKALEDKSNSNIDVTRKSLLSRPTFKMMSYLEKPVELLVFFLCLQLFVNKRIKFMKVK